MRWALLFILSFQIAIYSCKDKPQETVTEQDLILNSDSLKSYLRNKFEGICYLYCLEDLSYLDTLKDFYSARNYKPLWWEPLLEDSAAWDRLKSDFAYSEIHGMDQRYYFISMIDYYRSELHKLKNADSAYALLAELEILTSNSLVHMYNDIANGRTDPNNVFGAIYQLPKNNGVSTDWSGFLTSPDKKQDLDHLHKNDTTYNRLLDLLRVYKAKQLKEKQEPIDFSLYPKIEPGDTAPVLIQVVRKLRTALEPDSSILEVQESEIYGKDLVPVIKALQEKYNLYADGILGFKTYRIINSTAAERIIQIRANLERQRWFNKPPSQEAPYIYVNLPDYMVFLQYTDSFKFMKVCIGKNLPDDYDQMLQRYTDSGWQHKLPKNMETPQIYAKVSVVVLNPTWTVPRSIIEREMYWSMRRDPTYLSRHNYRVYRGKKEVQADTINWARYTPRKVPYRIVQEPGEDNSLGAVKYIFWNKFDIFMHDTPLKRKFEDAQRAVSHGCVRLELPLLFGEFVMQNSRKYNADDFRIMMGYPPLDTARLRLYDPEDSTARIQKIDTTFEIRLEKSIPIYMDYRTIFFTNDGQAHFRYDIYDRNKYILRRMDAF